MVLGSFAGLGFLAWYLSGKVRAFDRRGHVAKLCIIFLPLLVAALVGVSRVDDYWHHWQDVFAGGLLGLFVKYLFYFWSFLCWIVKSFYFLFFFYFKFCVELFIEGIEFLVLFLNWTYWAGTTIASFCYLQFFPPPYDIDGKDLFFSQWLCMICF